MLQWGHVLSNVDITWLLAIAQAVFDASMGPRPFERGYVAEGEREAGRIEASMGPRPFERGYDTAKAVVPNGKNASMGPRPFERGYGIFVTRSRLSMQHKDCEWLH